MKKKKLSLQSLEVESFVTSMKDQKAKTVKGGTQYDVDIWTDLSLFIDCPSDRCTKDPITICPIDQISVGDSLPLC